MNRNTRPTSIGIGGRLRPESPAGINRNGWPTSIGMSGRNQSEYAADYLLHAIVFLPWMFLLFFVPQGGKRVGRIWMWLGWLGLGVIIAVGVEVMQFWVPHRAFSPMDGVFGVVGVVVGGGLVLLRRLIR